MSNTKQYDNYADLITFTRASTGTALRHVGYGAELVTNGTFDTDISGWTVPAHQTAVATASGMQVTMDTGAAGGPWTGITTVAGKVYELTFDLTEETGANAQMYVRDGSAFGTTLTFNSNLTAGNSYTIRFVAIGTGTFLYLFSPASTAGSTMTWDNISVKEVIFDRATDPLVLFNHPTNVPRIEYDADGNRKGLLIEEARTNSIRNSVAGGAVVGSPGSLPTYWAVFGGTAATEIVATGTEAGVAYVDVRITGNPATGIFNFESSTQIPASEGESWSLNLNARIVAGDTTNVNELSPSINWRSSGAFLSRVTGEDFKDETNAGPRIVSGTAPATTDRVLPQIFVSCSGDVDFTLRVYAPQLEAGSFPTSYIPTAGSTATRAADVASIPTSAFGYNADKGTVVVDFEWNYTASGTGYPLIWAISDSTFNNRINLYTPEPTNTLVAEAQGGGLITLASGLAGSVSGKVSYAYAINNLAASLNGGVAIIDTSWVPASSNRTILHISGPTKRQAWIKSIQYYPRRLSNAQLQRLTA